MRSEALIVLGLISIFTIAGCSGSTSSSPNLGKDVLAKVDGKAITTEELNGRIKKLPPLYQNIVSQRKKEFLDDLITEKLLLDEATRRGIENTKEAQELLKEAKTKIIASLLIEKEAANVGAISDDDIKKYYDKNKESFVMPERMRASHILVDSEATAKDILVKIKNGADFAELAKEYSKDPTKDAGGDLGYFTKGQMIPEFEDACFKLEVGAVSPIVKTKFGYHIIKLTDKRPSRPQELLEVKERVKSILAAQAKKGSVEKFIGELKSKAKIQYNEEAIKEILPKESKETQPK